MDSFVTNFNTLMEYRLGSSMTVGKLVSAVLLAAVCIIIIKVINGIIRKATVRYDADKAVRNFIRLIVKAVLYFVAVLIIGDYVGIPMSSLLALFSVVGLAVSLSVQDLLGNVVGGFVIIMNKPFRADDYIDVAGVSGRVTNITLTYTTLVDYDNVTIFVPNKDASSKSVINYSLKGLRRLTLHVSASYASAPEEVRAALAEAVSATGDISPEFAPVTGVANYGSSAIEYDVHVWCENDIRLRVNYELNENIKKAFDAHGIEMTYNHLNVHVSDK